MTIKKILGVVFILISCMLFTISTFAYSEEGTVVEGFDIDPELFRCASANTNGWDLDHNRDGVVTLDEWKSTYGMVLKCEGYDIKDWSALKYFEDIHYLKIYDCKNADLSALNEIGHIMFLTITTDDFSTISGLDKGKCNVSSSDFISKTSVDLAKLSSLLCGKTLYIGAPECTNYDSLFAYELVDFSVSVEKKTDIDKLANKSLQRLHIKCPELEDVSFLNNCPNLIELRLKDCNITDGSPIGGCTDLNEINLSNNNISDISWIKNIDYVKRLYLEGNPIEAEDVLKTLYKEETTLKGVTDATCKIPLYAGYNLAYCDIVDRDKLSLEVTDESVINTFEQDVINVGCKSAGTSKIKVIYDDQTIRTYDVIVEEHQAGDWDYDGIMNAQDALEILKYAAKMYHYDPWVNEKGDVNEDEEVNAKDALEVLKIAAKITE